MISAFASKQFLLFLLAGGAAAAINFGSRIIYNQWWSFSASVIAAYLTGMITAFVLAKLFVFTDSQQTVRRSAVFFILINLLAVLQTWGTSMLLLRYGLPALGVGRFAPELAHAAGVVVPVFSSYLGHKRWSFK